MNESDHSIITINRNNSNYSSTVTFYCLLLLYYLLLSFTICVNGLMHVAVSLSHSNCLRVILGL